MRINSRRLKFVLSSSRHFVMNKLCPQNTSATDDPKSWEARLAKQTNMGMVKLYLNTMSSVTHPFLQALDINFQNWRLMALNRNPWRGWDTLPGTSRHLFNYIAREGPRHVALAAKKQSICEPIWRDVIDHVILNPQSAFCHILIRGREPLVQTPWRVFQEQQKSLDLLPIHTLVYLDLMQEVDLNVLCGQSAYIDQVPQRIGSPAEMPQFIESAMNRGFSLPREKLPSFEWTALQLACTYRNAMAVRTLLQAIRFHHPQSMNDQMCNFSNSHSPLTIETQNRGLEVIKLLLDADKVGPNSSGINSEATHEYFVSKQWACNNYLKGSPLHEAMLSFESKEMRQIFEVARPENIDHRDVGGKTALHVAVRKNDQGLVSMLIEEYGANPNPLGYDGESPAFIAFMLNKKDIHKYFQSHGVYTSIDSQEVKAWKRHQAKRARPRLHK